VNAVTGAAVPELELVQRVCDYIEQNIECAPTLPEIGAHFHMSHFHLQRTFKRVLGITPRQYAEGYRLQNLKGLLRDGQSVTSALYDVGYGSSSRLYERAPDMLGMTPLTYSRGGAGMNIIYTIMSTSLGVCSSAKPSAGCARFTFARRTRNYANSFSANTRWRRSSKKKMIFARGSRRYSAILTGRSHTLNCRWTYRQPPSN